MTGPQSWINRRSRRLVQAFQITRREAVANACIDWMHFYPTTKDAARHTQHV